MAKDELIDDRVSLAQCKKAVEALHKHASEKQAEKEQNELLPGKEQNIWLNVTVKKIHAERKFKPAKIPIKYPLVDPRTSGICLIVKDPQREYKDLLESHGIKFISRVVGITKLKGKFKPYEARRMLLKENAMFLVDDRVVEMMPKLLGVKWFEAKKQPIPVNLKRKDLKGELERAISSTYMNQNRGTYTSIKIANLSHKPSQILTNLQLALPAVAKAIPGGWDNIQNLGIKTNSSVSLPIWSCDLGNSEGGRWAGLTAVENSDSEEEEDTMEVEETPEKPEKKKKDGKKRSTDDLEDTGTPRKKAKPSVTADASTAESPTTTKKSKQGKTAQESKKSTEATTTESSSKAKTTGKSKQKADKAAPEAPTVAAIATAIETPVAAVVGEKTKKSKKPRATAAELMDAGVLKELAPIPTSATPTDKPKASKKDKKKKDEEKGASDEAEVAKAGKKEKVKAIVSETVTTSPSAEVKKSKKALAAGAKETEAVAAPVVETKKQKKDKNVESEVSVPEKTPKKVKAGDKKKEKVLSKSGIKSAKSELLKKKAGH